MKEGIISIKFKSEKAYDSVKFYGETISVADLKRNVEEKRVRRREAEGGKKGEGYELLLFEVNSKRKYVNETDHIPTNSCIIVERVPASATNYISNFKSQRDDDIGASNEEKPLSTAYMQMAKQSSNTITKGFNDIGTMLQQAVGAGKAVGVAPGMGPASAGGYMGDFDPSLMQKEDNVPKKYTWKQVDEMLTEARYFIIKSANQENINLSRKHSEWATTRANELETIKLGGCFKIEWITYAALSFNRLTGITNPLNNNEPIRKSRDTQELPNKEGKEVCRLFEIPIKEGCEDLEADEDGNSESSEDILNPHPDKKDGGIGGTGKDKISRRVLERKDKMMADDLKKLSFAFPQLSSDMLTNLTPTAINLMPEQLRSLVMTKMLMEKMATQGIPDSGADRYRSRRKRSHDSRGSSHGSNRSRDKGKNTDDRSKGNYRNRNRSRERSKDRKKDKKRSTMERSRDKHDRKKSRR